MMALIGRETQVGTGGHGPGAVRSNIDDITRSLHYLVIDELGSKVSESDEPKRLIENHLAQLLNREATPLSASDRRDITESIINDILGYGPIQRYLEDPEVTEVMVNSPDRIYIERAGRIQPTASRFLDETHLLRTIDRIVTGIGRRIDESSPMVDARLPDGSRVNAVIAPLALNGPILTIRKFSREPLTVDDLIGFGTLTPKAAEFLHACVKGKMSVLISGGTGTGKTTLLNVVSSFIPSDERIVTIEDAAELQLRQEHVLRLESRPSNLEGKGQVTIRDLVRNSLRMRPDRIVVGEVRGAESLDMLQAMNTGHEGSLSTVHSNSPRDALARIETMVLMAGYDLPVRAIREQVSSALNLVVHLARLRDGSRRIVNISEVQQMEGDTIVMQDIFYYDYSMGVDSTGRFLGHLKSSGIRPSFSEKLEHLGIVLPPDMFAFEAPARR